MIHRPQRIRFCEMLQKRAIESLSGSQPTHLSFGFQLIISSILVNEKHSVLGYVQLRTVRKQEQ